MFHVVSRARSPHPCVLTRNVAPTSHLTSRLRRPQVDSTSHTNMARYGLHVLAKLDDLDDGAAAITSPTKQPLLPMTSLPDSTSPLLEQAAEEPIEEPPLLSRAQMKAHVDELERRERTRRKKRGARKSTANADINKKDGAPGVRRRVIALGGAARRVNSKNTLL